MGFSWNQIPSSSEKRIGFLVERVQKAIEIESNASTQNADANSLSIEYQLPARADLTTSGLVLSEVTIEYVATDLFAVMADKLTVK